jgi:hypothetical protein
VANILTSFKKIDAFDFTLFLMFLVSIVVLSARVGYILQSPQELNPEPFPEMALPVNRQAVRDACSLQIKLGFLVFLGTVAYNIVATIGSLITFISTFIFFLNILQKRRESDLRTFGGCSVFFFMVLATVVWLILGRYNIENDFYDSGLRRNYPSANDLIYNKDHREEMLNFAINKAQERVFRGLLLSGIGAGFFILGCKEIRNTLAAVLSQNLVIFFIVNLRMLTIKLNLK